MLDIDRVHSDVDLVPGAEPPPATALAAEAVLRALVHDAAARGRFRAAVLEVLRDALREIERRGRA